MVRIFPIHEHSICKGVAMKLYVARHGQTQYNLEKRICGRADVPLTKRGIMQAHELAEIMKPYSVDKIIASPAKRARDTAVIVGRAVGADVIFDDRLFERDFGDTDGTPEATPGFQHQFEQFAYQYPNGESLLRVVQRIYNFLDEVKFKYQDQNIMIISHGGVCRVIHSYFNSEDTREFFDFFLENAKVMEYDI